MHGIIFRELKKFAGAALGPDGWEQLTTRAGTSRMSHLVSESYPDEELTALVTAAVEITGIPAQALLAQFGEFLVPGLLQIYGGLLPKRWTALDMLEQTETLIHRAVRLRDKSSTPPELHIVRPSPDRVEIHYSSPRRLCAVGRGIMVGVGKHYKEPLTVEETDCMLLGAKECVLVATLSSPSRG